MKADLHLRINVCLAIVLLAVCVTFFVKGEFGRGGSGAPDTFDLIRKHS